AVVVSGVPGLGGVPVTPNPDMDTSVYANPVAPDVSMSKFNPMKTPYANSAVGSVINSASSWVNVYSPIVIAKFEIDTDCVASYGATSSHAMSYLTAPSELF